MANRPHAPTSTPRARNVEPQPAPMAQPAETASTKRDLTSWWKQFSKRGNPKREEEKGICISSERVPSDSTSDMVFVGLLGQFDNAERYAPFYGQPQSLKRPIKHGLISNFYSIDRVIPGIFGVPLATSITYANVAISLFNDGGESYIYGYVPIVVAKCGVFLKEKG